MKPSVDEYLPLSLKKEESDFQRGLSINETSKLPALKNHYPNPSAIPARHPRYKMTIVWDLDQTLVSAEGLPGEKNKSYDHKLIIRPRANEVLNLIRAIPEVEFIVWTAGDASHAKRVCYSLGLDYFDYVISRSSYWDVIKDLNMLQKTGRSLHSMILIDDRMDIGLPHPENLLIVPAYIPGDCGANDATMLYLANIIFRCCIKYLKNDGKYPLRMYLHSPLTQRCRDYQDGRYGKEDYYGVNCLTSKQQLAERIQMFRR